MKKKCLKFDSDCEYGMMMAYDGRYSDLKSNSLPIISLHKLARKMLPPGEYYELRATFPTYYGCNKHLVWYREPYMDKKLMTLSYNEWKKINSYYLIGRYIT